MKQLAKEHNEQKAALEKEQKAHGNTKSELEDRKVDIRKLQAQLAKAKKGAGASTSKAKGKKAQSDSDSDSDEQEETQEPEGSDEAQEPKGSDSDSDSSDSDSSDSDSSDSDSDEKEEKTKKPVGGKKKAEADSNWSDGEGDANQDSGDDSDDDDSEDEEDRQVRAKGKGVFGARIEAKAAAAATKKAKGGKKGNKVNADGEQDTTRGVGKIKGALRTRYQNATCFGDAGRPNIDFASIDTFKKMGWTTEKLMLDAIKKELGSQHTHANLHYQAALDILAMPVEGKDFLKDKSFKAAIKFWCEWTNPDSQIPGGLQGKRHFFGTKFYPDLYGANIPKSWLKKGVVEDSDEDNLHKYCLGQVEKRMRYIKFFNRVCKFGFIFTNANDKGK